MISPPQDDERPGRHRSRPPRPATQAVSASSIPRPPCPARSPSHPAVPKLADISSDDTEHPDTAPPQTIIVQPIFYCKTVSTCADSSHAEDSETTRRKRRRRKCRHSDRVRGLTEEIERTIEKVLEERSEPRDKGANRETKEVRMAKGVSCTML
jgi:hypothetical protein